MRNTGADCLSQGEKGKKPFFKALAARARSQLRPVEIEFPPEAFAIMYAAMGVPHRHRLRAGRDEVMVMGTLTAQTCTMEPGGYVATL